MPEFPLTAADAAAFRAEKFLPQTRDRPGPEGIEILDAAWTFELLATKGVAVANADSLKGIKIAGYNNIDPLLNRLEIVNTPRTSSIDKMLAEGEIAGAVLWPTDVVAMLTGGGPRWDSMILRKDNRPFSTYGYVLLASKSTMGVLDAATKQTVQEQIAAATAEVQQNIEVDLTSLQPVLQKYNVKSITIEPQ